jgi:hypothetical protein
MGLFFDILSSINNPNQAGNVEQLTTVTNAIAGLAEKNGISPQASETVLSSLGGYLRSALGEQRSALGAGGLENQIGQMLGGGNPLGGLLGQLTGGGIGASALGGLLSPGLQQQIADGIAQKTGLRSEQILSALPVLVLAVLGLLNMGKGTGGGIGSNPLLSSFLDTDKDGDTDLGDVLHFASRFVNPAS